MNKKAQFDVAKTILFWMMAGIMLTVILFAFGMIMVGYKSKLTYVPPQLKAELISLRFVNSPDCFAYQDQTGRVFPGIIDLKKYSSSQLKEDCYPTALEKDFSFALELKGKNVKIKTEGYSHRDLLTLTKNVLIEEQGELQPDQLWIYIQENSE